MTVVAPLRSEQVALRLGGVRAVRGGMGAKANPVDGEPIVVAGVCGAVDPSLRPGDVVVATELHDGAAVHELRGTATLARALRDRGLRVVTGPILVSDRVLGRDERRALQASGIVAVDMESSCFAPTAVVRVVVDTAQRGLLHPATLIAGPRALASLRRAAPAIAGWALEAVSVEDGTVEAPREVRS